jgi:hypothetical protein
MDFKFGTEDQAFRIELRSPHEENIPRDWHNDGEMA